MVNNKIKQKALFTKTPKKPPKINKSQAKVEVCMCVKLHLGVYMRSQKEHRFLMRNADVLKVRGMVAPI